MAYLIDKALLAKRESKYIEFKEFFDPAIPRDWCELIKDFVAIANSGGGVIIFGLDNTGNPTKRDVKSIANIDPADFVNKIVKYTGPSDLEFEITLPKKQGQKLVAFVIHPVSIPIVFQKPGTYDIGLGKQANAFSVGTVYFRHGAKSEPGTSADIRKVIERQLENIRKSWLKGVRKVVQAPQGSQIVTLNSTSPQRSFQGFEGNSKFRVVNDPEAIPIRVTRDLSKSAGSFLHEEISDGIFDEINNVVDANRVLAKSQKRFLLGPSIYYRIYAERHHVLRNDPSMNLLFSAGVSKLNAPAMFWSLSLSEIDVAKSLSDLYFLPKNPHIYNLLKYSIFLGKEFCLWLFGKWEDKWKKHPQPPNFFWGYKEMITKLKKSDARLIAGNLSPSTVIEFENVKTSISQLLEKPEKAANILSKVCVTVFNGDIKLKPLTRTLDYFAYGPDFQKRAPEIAKQFNKIVGDKIAGDIVEQVVE